MPVSNADLAERLGELKGRMEHVVDELGRARDDRGKLFGKMEDQSRRIDNVERSVSHVETSVKELTTSVDGLEHLPPLVNGLMELKPIVENWKSLRLKILGGLAVVIFLSGLIGWIVSTFASEIWAWLFVRG